MPASSTEICIAAVYIVVGIWTCGFCLGIWTVDQQNKEPFWGADVLLSIAIGITWPAWIIVGILREAMGYGR